MLGLHDASYATVPLLRIDVLIVLLTQPHFSILRTPFSVLRSRLSLSSCIRPFPFSSLGDDERVNGEMDHLSRDGVGVVRGWDPI